MKRSFSIVVIALLGACDRNDSSGFVPTTPATALPVAVAGEDQEVLASAAVTLKGDKSYDPAGGTPTYQWTQILLQPTDPQMTLLPSDTVASPTFTAPASPITLRFELAVTGANGTDRDTVDVIVKSMRVTAPDSWFVGYGRGDAGSMDEASIAATVAGGTGPYTFEWTGLEAWFDTTTPTTETVAGPTHTLKGITPHLADFQNFPDRAEVGIIQKTTQGRLQLKVKVTDSSLPTALSDEELVNFSAGPFSDAVANENAALGEPVFLNGAATNSGGAITAWSWSLNAVPVGSTAVLNKPNKSALGGATTERFVYFVPDKVGEYQILVTQTSTGSPQIKVITIIAGKYVGVGNLTGTTPDPIKGECAACHGGQLGWLADFANPWKQTGHARMFSRLLDPADPLHGPANAKETWNDLFNFGSSYSVDSRTVGWSRLNPPASAQASGGWAHQAEADGYVFKDSTWPELIRKHPKTAGRSNVQCESCHGPGSEHAGDSQFIRKSYDVSVCGRCHSRKQDHWEASTHGTPLPQSPTFPPTGRENCNNCHTAQGFIVDMRAKEGDDPYDVLFSLSNINRPVLVAEERRGVTCQACHEPHKKTANRTAPGVDPQLRAFGNVRFRNGAVVNAGEAAVCFMCHQSRRDTSNVNGDMDRRSSPHDSTAAEMLTGNNGFQFAGWSYASSPHGIADRFVTPSRGENRQCLACHADVQPAAGVSGYNALGGHTFHVKQGTGAAVADNVTHGAVTTDAAAKTLLVNPATTGPSFLKRVFTGDTVLLDGAPNTVAKVDGARQVTLGTAPAGSVTTWSITSALKYNTTACTQCHTMGTTFDVTARGDYDGDGVPETIQNEIAGLRAALVAAIETKLNSLTGKTCTLVPGRIQYQYANPSPPPTVLTRIFPGPAASSTNNDYHPWDSVADKDGWTKVYGAAYNLIFEANDKSRGIHNTGYAINLLQSSYWAVTGTTIGAPFVPF